MNPSGLQAAVVLPTLADLGCLPLPCASGAAEASDSIGGAEQKKNSNTYLSTESGEVQVDCIAHAYAAGCGRWDTTSSFTPPTVRHGFSEWTTR